VGENLTSESISGSECSSEITPVEFLNEKNNHNVKKYDKKESEDASIKRL